MRSAFVQIIAAVTAGFVALVVPHIALAQSKWQVVPLPDAFDFPQEALDEGLSGSATVSCNATNNGVVETCELVSETPEGYGFGQSALRIVRRGQLIPSADGQPYRNFQITVPFGLDTGEPDDAEAPPAPRAIWKSAPSPRARDFPSEASYAGVSGTASITCTASPEGIPQGCFIASETPAGYGFGEAAMRIVRRARLQPNDLDVPFESFTVRVPFNFN